MTQQIQHQHDSPTQQLSEHRRELGKVHELLGNTTLAVEFQDFNSHAPFLMFWKLIRKFWTTDVFKVYASGLQTCIKSVFKGRQSAFTMELHTI